LRLAFFLQQKFLGDPSKLLHISTIHSFGADILWYAHVLNHHTLRDPLYYFWILAMINKVVMNIGVQGFLVALGFELRASRLLGRYSASPHVQVFV
jgi:hypothetical protein